jgi:DNA-binding MarR family transcriptional regulator
MSTHQRSTATTSSGGEQTIEAVRALVRVSRVLERASDELSLAHYRVLSAVAAGDRRATRVAARLALGKPTVSAAVDALNRRGLITRSSVPTDQRAAQLSVTPEGRAVLARVEREMGRRIDGLCARTPDRGRLVQSLVWLGEALDEAAAERATASRPARR